MSSQGRNNRYVEMLDFFPTAIELMGLPSIPTCRGVDQPPTVLCLQGQSYADEFLPKPALATATTTSTPKQHVFSQWPYPKSKGNDKDFRMGYTVRSADDFRLTQYVPYSLGFRKGDWLRPAGKDDLELYDYNTDPDERVNQAADPKHQGVVAKLVAVLKEQFDPKSVEQDPRQ